MLANEPFTTAAPACCFCSTPERIELFEIWDSHQFMLETCCESFHASVVHEMAEDPAWACALLRHLGAEEVLGAPLRRLADDQCGSMLLDWKLRLSGVSFAAARDFVRRHHAHCNPPVTWRFGQAILNGRTLLGVVIVGNPVAPGLNGRGIIEVNRLCIRRDLPRPLPAADERLVAVIRSMDGCWHRPFTTAELAVLQSLFDTEDQFELDGLSDAAWRERVGNSVPPDAATAIANTMGTTLLLAWSGTTFMLSSVPIWVRPVAVALSVRQEGD